MNKVLSFNKPRIASGLVLLFAVAAASQAQAAQTGSVWPEQTAATVSFGEPGFDEAPQSAASSGFVDPMAAVEGHAGGKQEAAAADSGSTLSFVDSGAPATQDDMEARNQGHTLAAGEPSMQNPSSITAPE